MGCAATDGGLLSRVKERLRGKTESGGEATTAPANATAQAKAPAAAERDNVVPAAADLANKPIGEIAESIVARVNGDVILAQDLFNPIRAQLAKAQQEMKPSEFAQYRSRAIQQKLRDLIERQLLIQEAKRTLPDPLVKRMEAMADKEFGKQIEAGMKKMEVNTESELRRKMLETGESLDQMRDFQRGTFVAQQYLRMQLQPRLDVSREEMVDYYNSHRDEFTTPGGVRWSEIFLSFEKYGSRDAARAKADQIVAELRAGADFAAVALADSEGATSSDGGRWDLTARNSLVVKSLDDALFSLPVGKIREPIEGAKGWHIVRVDEEQEGGKTSFVDAQDKIRNAIREQKINKESQRFVQELVRKADVTTIFDRPNPGAQAASKAK
jgi:peptidyl-prolyl cis-trans isomerase SurA